QLVLEILGDMTHVDGLIVHARSPEGQPAEAALQHAIADGGEAIHDAAADERGGCPHATPWMTRETTEEWVAPEVTVARIPEREAVMDHSQSLVGRRGPDW